MSALDDVVNTFMNQWDVPGGAAAVTYQGRLVYARGFGYADVDNQIPVEPTSLFRIASVSKSITGIAMAKLIEEGLLSTADKVFGEGGILTGSRYDTLVDVRMQNITVGDLLHHTAGFGTLGNGRDPVFADIYEESIMHFGLPHSPEDKIEFYLQKQTLKREPGTAYEYSNLGYLILGRVIEQVTGMSYTDYCRTALFEPLGITSIKMGNSLLENRLPGEVLYYDYPQAPNVTSVYGTGASVPWTYGGMNVETFDSHGGWAASAVDLLRLLTAVDGFSTRPDILTSSGIAAMTSTTPQSAGYAFGFSTNQFDNWWHMGSIPGATAMWARINNGVNFVFLFNTRPGNQLSQFNGEVDALYWNAQANFTSWPAHDLFDQFTSIEPTADGTSLSIDLYPNPSTERVNVRLNGGATGSASLSVYDLLGRKVKAVYDGVIAGETELSIDVSELTNGLYLARAQSGSQVATRQFVVQR